MKIIKIENIELSAESLLTTDEVAIIYGISPKTIREHKRLHQDELIEDRHYVITTSQKGTKKLLWTLEGIYMLGFFIKSERAKKYRRAIAQLLKEIKVGNVEVRKTFDNTTQELLNTIKEQSEKLIEYKNKIEDLKDKLIEQLLLNVKLLQNQPAPSIKRKLWSREEEKKLIELYKLGYPAEEIATSLNRSISSIKGKIHSLAQKGILNV